MGLDSYFYRLDDEKLGYLRNAHMIHYWIENRIRKKDPEFSTLKNCGFYGLDYEDLKDLYCDIKFVLKNPESADKLIPNVSSYLEYDMFYFNTLKKTKQFLKDILDEYSCNDVFIYFAWW